MSDEANATPTLQELQAELDDVCGQLLENRLKMVQLDHGKLVVRMVWPDEVWVKLDDFHALVKACQLLLKQADAFFSDYEDVGEGVEAVRAALKPFDPNWTPLGEATGGSDDR